MRPKKRGELEKLEAEGLEFELGQRRVAVRVKVSVEPRGLLQLHENALE